MKILGCVLDGFEVKGFIVENNKGAVKKTSYSSTISGIQKNRFEGLSYKEIDGQDIIVGLNYQELKMVNLKDVDFRIEDDKVFMDDQEIDDNNLWNYCVNGEENNINIGLDLKSGGLKILDIN